MFFCGGTVMAKIFHSCKKKSKIIAFTALVLLFFSVMLFCGFRPEKTASFFAMDTYCSVKVKGKNSADCVSEAEKLTRELDENILTRHNDFSFVSRLNSERKSVLDEKEKSRFETMLGLSRDSGGAFDFTLGALSDLWGFGEEPAVPDEKRISEVLGKTGFEKITLKGNEISFPQGIVIDMGAVGKGIALDEIKTVLDENKASSAVISIGGSILLYGKDDMTVGITDPTGKSQYMAVLIPGECCVSTSGSYERFFEQNGKKYHHILDPETGFPAENGLVSVTVCSESGLLSDALSTACFVLGKEKGMALLEKYGCEGVFIDGENGVSVTDGLKDRLEITDSRFVLRQV